MVLTPKTNNYYYNYSNQNYRNKIVTNSSNNQKLILK